MLGLRNNNPSQLLLQGTLLSGIIRTGAWAGSPGDRLLDITLAPDQQSLASPAPASTAAAAAVGGSGSAGADSTAVVIDPRLQDGSDSSGGQEAAPLQQQQTQHPASGVRLAVRLKNGRVSAKYGRYGWQHRAVCTAVLCQGTWAASLYLVTPCTKRPTFSQSPMQVLAEVHVCNTAWHPLGMTNRVCSDLEKWEFADWQDWPQGCVGSCCCCCCWMPAIELHGSLGRDSTLPACCSPGMAWHCLQSWQ